LESFHTLLNRAQQGDQHAIEQLLLLYKPLIDWQSRTKDEVDEDLHQFIILRILINFKNFY
jgi:hypothetical protein